MTSQRAVLVGSQKPRLLQRPPWTTEESAEEAIELAESVGLVLDPWQQTLVRMILAERADGKYAASEAGYLVARQNGKGAVLEAIALHGLFLVGDPMTLWTAHEFKTAAEAYERMKGWIEASDDLSRLVSKMGGVGTGQFEIGLSNGPRLRFLARSRKSGRGLSPQRIFFDEAQELSRLAVGALTFSTAAQANRQLIFTGTVPTPEDNAEHWTSIRDRGREGKSTKLAWAEWTPKGSDDPAVQVDLDDRRNWAASNPALGYRLAEEGFAGEREELISDPEMFARERCSVWPTYGAAGGDIDPAAWAALGSDDRIEGALALGIAMSPDRSTVTVGVAGIAADGRRIVRTGMSRRGTSWLVPWLLDALDERQPVAVAIDIGSAAGALVPELEAAGIDLDVLTLTEMTGACGLLVDSVANATLLHPRDDHHLNSAVAVAKARTLTRGGWLWDDRGRDGMGPLLAVTHALAGLEAHGDIDYDITDSFG